MSTVSAECWGEAQEIEDDGHQSVWCPSLLFKANWGLAFNTTGPFKVVSESQTDRGLVCRSGTVRQPGRWLKDRSGLQGP